MAKDSEHGKEGLLYTKIYNDYLEACEMWHRHALVKALMSAVRKCSYLRKCSTVNTFQLLQPKSNGLNRIAMASNLVAMASEHKNVQNTKWISKWPVENVSSKLHRANTVFGSANVYPT